MTKEQCLDKLEYATEVIDKISRGYDYITEDGKVYKFTPAQIKEMCRGAINALAEVSGYVNPSLGR